MVLSTEAAAWLFLVVLCSRYTEFEEGSVRSLVHFRNRFIAGSYHYFRPIIQALHKGISQQNMALYGTVPPF